MTCREVFNRIRWDQRIDASTIKVGIDDRFLGTVEVDFHDARLGGDVPWHRVQHFSYLGTMVWNRQGLDILETTLTQVDNDVCSGMLKWNIEQGEWIGQQSTSQLLSCRKIRLLTLNVLFDLYDKDVPKTEARLPPLVALLKSTDADLVALQEVTPKLLALLLKESWIRENYSLSQAPGGPNITPYGQLLLCKIPCTIEYKELIAGKTILRACLLFDSGQVQLVVLHLYSDRKAEAASKRREQIDEIEAYLDPDSTHWIVGDFNERGALPTSGFQDAWSSLRPSEFGFTFDPVTNALAKQTSRRGIRARFDRILFRGAWTAGQIELVPAQHSDHHALVCEFTPPIIEKPVHKSALVFIPPESCWPPIQALREQYDKSFQRWMPHINLLYGFVPESHFEPAVELLKNFLINCPQFTIRLKEYARFYHRASTTVWLRPECQPAGALKHLQSQIQEFFPQCLEQSAHSESGFTPHLTVASLKKGAVVPELPLLDLHLKVENLALISREADSAFQIQHRIPLGSPPLARCLPTKLTSPEFPNELKEKVELLGLVTFPVGSTALGLGLPSTDVDLVVVGHAPAESIFQKFPQGRVAPGRVPVMKMEEHNIDLQYCRYPNDLALKAPELLSDQEFQSLEALAQRVAQARRDLCLLRRRLEQPRDLEVLRVIRLWAQARCLDRQGFGFPGGLAWAILVAWSVEGASAEASLEGLVHRFFLWAETWPWPQPLVLNSELDSQCRVRQRDRLPVFSLTAPAVNVAGNVTPGTRENLFHEFRRAQALCERNRWDELFQPLPWAGGVKIEVSAQKKGWVEGQIVDLLLRAEAQGHWVRAHSFVQESDGTVLRILCEENPPMSLLSKLGQANITSEA